MFPFERTLGIASTEKRILAKFRPDQDQVAIISACIMMKLKDFF